PFRPEDVRRVKAALPGVSERRLCRLLLVARASVRPRPARPPRAPRPESPLVAELQRLLTEHPTYGYRRLWALLRLRDGQCVNKKAGSAVVRRKGRFVHQREVTPRPRVQGLRSQARRSDERWAMDVTHIDCGVDGWAHLAAVIDCHDREVIGWELA